uniref:Fibronectin type-III domain-containing protein n=1 Tax=Lepeophtheirus salmonis TaxID=72036 RepID=A0A0K2TEH9_LEPSM
MRDFLSLKEGSSPALLLLGLFIILRSCQSENCDGLLKTVLQHNSPEFVGFTPLGPVKDKEEESVRFTFTWDHIHSLIKDCASFYLLERRAVSYRKISKRESSYHTSEISEPIKNGTGSFNLPSRDCKVYSTQLTVSSSVDGSLYYSQPLRLWPIAYLGARVKDASDNSFSLIWPTFHCPLPKRVKLLALSSSHEPVQTRRIERISGLKPCTPYEIVLEDAQESPIWSTRFSTKPSPPKILVIPGHRTMTVTTTTGDCPSSRSELTTEITYCTTAHEANEGSGSGYGEEILQSFEEETCVTRTLSESGTPKRILLNNLSPCTIYSLRFRTVDMSAARAENTVLQEYDAAHSTLCIRRDEKGVEEEGTTPLSTVSSETDGGFWFDHTTEEDSLSERNHHFKPEIHKPEIRRTHRTSHLGLDVTIGISLGLSCLFILIGATVIASVFHLYYNNKISPKFSKIAHIECEEDEEDEYDDTI